MLLYIPYLKKHRSDLDGKPASFLYIVLPKSLSLYRTEPVYFVIKVMH